MYELLGISADATRADLDAAYRAKHAACDPAQLAEMGEEFVQLAVQRRAEYTIAYQTLRSAVAAPLTLPPASIRRRDRETIVALLVFVAIALVVPLVRGVAVPVSVVSAAGADVAALRAKSAPDFRLEALDGRQVSVSDFKGKVVLANLWATWCPPCVRETPRLVRLAEQYKAQGLVVLGINTTYQDDRAKVAAFVREHKISYPVLLDTKDEFGQAYAARLLPTSYLIDQEGRIVQIKVGEIDEAQLGAQVQALLKSGKENP